MHHVLPLEQAEQAFSRSDWRRGRRLVVGARVTERVGTSLRTEVADGRRRYRQRVDLALLGLDGWGACTCYRGSDCVHLAAVVLAVLARRPGFGGLASPDAELPEAADELVAALVEGGHGDLLELPFRVVQAARGTRFRGLPDGLTVCEALELHGLPGWQAEAVPMHTRQYLRDRVGRRALATSLRDYPSPDSPELVPPHRALSELREHLRGAVVAEAWEGRVELEPEAERVRYLEEGGPCGPALLETAMRDPVLPDCPCGEALCATRLRAVEAWLGALAEPGAHRSLWREVLAQPAWSRRLARVEELLEGDLSDDEGRLLGWRLEEEWGCLDLLPIWVRRYQGKAGFRRWKAPLDDRGALAVATAAEERLLAHPRGAFKQPALRNAALAALVDHPRVFVQDSPFPVRVRQQELGTRLVPDGDAVRLEVALGGEVLAGEALQPLADARGGFHVVLDDSLDGDIVVVPVQRRLARLLKLVVDRGDTFPREALPRLLRSLPQLQDLAPVELDPSLRGQRHEGPTRPLFRVQLEAGPALDLRARVRVAPGIPPLVAGQGRVEVHGFVDDAHVVVERDVDAEVALVAACVRRLGLEPGDHWHLDDPEEALDLVEALRGLDAEIDWADSPAVFRAQAGDLTLRVDSGHDWFGLEGEVRVGGLGVPLQALLEALRDGRRFVRASEGSWVRLSRPFAERLRALAATARDEGGLRVPRIGVAALEGLAEAGAEVEAEEGFELEVGRLREAAGLDPTVPAGLRAELRDYQLVGFEWLARLAHWAPGAVLADDMGLGKTVQALALLLRRQGEGPVLVVAPTSVGANWLREAARFAPELPAAAYRGSARAELLNGLERGVLVTSYEILLRDVEALSQVRWGTVVLDEAQAIKNAGTARAKAAAELGAGFVLALTGTPVENRSSELWSLFRVVAPGLLGSHGRFTQLYARPIEAHDDDRAKAALAELIAPFVLRRRKGEVETSLPPRTEVLVPVTPSAGERKLYDAVRLAAVERLEGREGEGGWSMEVLAALTRLRQLACHPSLVLADAEGPSSKLEKVLEVLGDLLDRGERALVFSQFVQHLALVRAELEARGVPYRYLDGSTPAAARQVEVDAFQQGQGALFLISLKAGGVGLNLTGASNVLHLDPWWNPAVEDQASDRAHRIGQTRPVTVYRFVTEGTVEEAIVAMQADKRELAEALLSGSGSATSLGPEELMKLLR